MATTEDSRDAVKNRSTASSHALGSIGQCSEQVFTHIFKGSLARERKPLFGCARIGGNPFLFNESPHSLSFR
jgi:hypothetical protein